MPSFLSIAFVALATQMLPLFLARSDLVVLHALVTDGDGTPVSGLSADAFTVWENDRRQTIEFFAPEDTPVTVGLLVDVSGSMFAERATVAAAASLFVERSNPADEIFAMAFDDRVRATLPGGLPFTHDAAVVRRALAGAPYRGGWTALHDAVVAAIRQVRQGSHSRRALIVVSDGGDNASRISFRELMAQAKTSDTVIYTVALVDPFSVFVNPKRLAQLAAATGGKAFRPSSVGGVEEAFHRIADDLRSAYTIGYAPATPITHGQYRRIRAVARTPQGRVVAVQTRQGYIAEP
jgi:Ca-activated chloride channel family protein